jgi:hypothetical protein
MEKHSDEASIMENHSDEASIMEKHSITLQRNNDTTRLVSYPLRTIYDRKD